jgi:hypothetical protein
MEGISKWELSRSWYPQVLISRAKEHGTETHDFHRKLQQRGINILGTHPSSGPAKIKLK